MRQELICLSLQSQEQGMGKRGLYPTLADTNIYNEELKLMMDFISLCDGKVFLLEIADKLNVPIWKLYELIDKLINHKLITEVD